MEVLSNEVKKLLAHDPTALTEAMNKLQNGESTEPVTVKDDQGRDVRIERVKPK